MPRPKRPFVVGIDEVRIVRQPTGVFIDYADPEAVFERVTVSSRGGDTTRAGSPRDVAPNGHVRRVAKQMHGRQSRSARPHRRHSGHARSDDSPAHGIAGRTKVSAPPRPARSRAHQDHRTRSARWGHRDETWCTCDRVRLSLQQRPAPPRRNLTRCESSQPGTEPLPGDFGRSNS
jgi:hypothetical protein